MIKKMKTTILGKRTVLFAFVSLIVLSGVMSMSMNANAMETNDVSLCEKITTTEMIEYCYLNFARRAKDSGFCEKITDLQNPPQDH